MCYLIRSFIAEVMVVPLSFLEDTSTVMGLFFRKSPVSVW